MNNIYYKYYESPIGLIEIGGNDSHVYSLYFVNEKRFEEKVPPDLLIRCANELDEYFKGTRKRFSVPTYLDGTTFQVRVWLELLNIPYGRTASYLDIANKISNEKSVRAVGSANGKNKISIIIPCHRVIGKNGSLTGYAGELWRKKWLLEHEKNTLF